MTSINDTGNDTSKPPRVDRRAMRELIEVLGAAATRGVLATFIADATTRLAAIEAAAAARRMATVGDHLHTLKSTSATLGLVGFAELAHALEAEAARTTVEPARTGALRALFEASIAELTAGFPELA